MKNKYTVDYYTTKKEISSDDFYQIKDKIKISCLTSDNSLGDNLDIFINKKDINDTPSRHDLVFFTNEKRFYHVEEVEEVGSSYLINLSKYEQKEKIDY